MSAEATTASGTDVATTAVATTVGVSTPGVTGQTTGQIFMCTISEALISRNDVLFVVRLSYSP